MSNERNAHKRELELSSTRSLDTRRTSLVKRGIQLVHQLKVPHLRVLVADHMFDSMVPCWRTAISEALWLYSERFSFNAHSGNTLSELQSFFDQGRRERYHLRVMTTVYPDELLQLAQRHLFDMFILSLNNILILGKTTPSSRIEKSLQIITHLRTTCRKPIIVLADDDFCSPGLAKAAKLAGASFFFSCPSPTYPLDTHNKETPFVRPRSFLRARRARLEEIEDVLKTIAQCFDTISRQESAQRYSEPVQERQGHQPVEQAYPTIPNKKMYEIEAFEARIREQETLLFGTTLFYQGILQVWAADESILKMNRESYERTSKRMNEAIRRARQILNEAQENPTKSSLLQQFEFPPTKDEMAKRAPILVEAYDELFPGRPRDKALNEKERLRLMEVASNRL